MDKRVLEFHDETGEQPVITIQSGEAFGSLTIFTNGWPVVKLTPEQVKDLKRMLRGYGIRRKSF
jgi:hypothetical protein